MSVQHVPAAGGRASFYRVRWLEEGVHRSKSFPDTREGHRQALRFDAKMSERTDMGAFAPTTPSRMTLDEWAERWTDVHALSWRASTRRERGSHLDVNIIPHLGGVRMRDLGRARIQDYRRDMLAAGATPKTVNSAMRVLSACLGVAVEEGIIPMNPCAGLRKLPTEPVDRTFVPIAVVEEIRAKMPAKEHRLIVSLMAYGGLRPGEVGGVRGEDISQASVQVLRALGEDGVQGTKSLSRPVPMRWEIERDLTFPLPRGPLFVGPRGGAYNHHNWHRRVWMPLLETVDYGHFVPYELRHTAATLWIDEGASVLEVAAWMGHTSPKMVMEVYGHLFTEREHRDRASSRRSGRGPAARRPDAGRS